MAVKRRKKNQKQHRRAIKRWIKKVKRVTSR
jgi:hypothetical protein